MRRFAALGLAALVAAGGALGAGSVAVTPAWAAGNVSVTGLPLPRFVSLKASRVNVRVGPGNGYSTKWIFVRSGLPVEVIQEFENWRRIRDSNGEEGWVYWSLLSGKRTALVSPWDDAKQVPLHYAADDQASVVAILDPNVVAEVESCDGKWCKIRGKGFRGYAHQDSLWGVYPDETVK
ncbi:SH3 domain-containing protein [Rhizobiales bacterium Sp-1]|uniref:SH3 domain-containing protein n=1 Tax=Segnochrobactrum spirostomi TaxID=2608987 RepID=A0A6A7Y3D0_9HYPH|nr:SH3 domain-containing protein [Segnochrobactrum spirostomi]